MRSRSERTIDPREMGRRRAGGIIWLAVIVVLASISISFQYHIFSSVDSYFKPGPHNEFGNSLRRIVTLAKNAVEPILSEVRSGRLTKGEGLRRAGDLVRTMVYQDDYGPNYVFLTGYDGTLFVQPFNPALEGTNQWNLRDSNGFFIARELPAAARAHPEGAFVSYFYPPPGKTASEEKLAFVIGIPELEALIGTGMYAEAFSAERGRVLTRARLESVFLMLGTAFVAGLILFVLYSSNRRLHRELARLSETETALALSERNLKDVFDLLDEGVIIHDKEGRLLDCNEGLLRMHGIDRETAAGFSVFDLSADGYDRDAVKLMYDKLAYGSVFRFDWKSRRYPSGQDFDTEVVLKKGEWNGESAFIAEVRDVTEKKAAEDALLARTAELERFERLMVGRELKMMELKKKMGELEAREDTADGR